MLPTVCEVKIPMLAALLLLGSSALALEPETVRLRRFERIDPYRQMQAAWGEKAYAYMDTADTYLDSGRPNDNFGAARTLRLASGRGSTVLLQFGQLNRAVWRNAKVISARLILHPVPGRFTSDTKVVLKRVQREWADGGADGAPMHWTATWKDAFSNTRAEPIAWQTAGAGGHEDTAAKPSWSADTSTGYSRSSNQWVLEGPGITEDVRLWLGRHYRNHGWALTLADPKTANGPVELFSGDAMEKELRPTLEITFQPEASESVRQAPDLNVIYIARTPRYLRYNDNGRTTYERKRFRGGNPGIMKFPDNADTKKWPAKGESLTYSAVVKNTGTVRYKGQVRIWWTYNQKRIGGDTVTVDLAPESKAQYQIILPWKGDMRDARDEKLTFQIEPVGDTPEVTKNNNWQSKYLKAKTWKYWVERSAYEYANKWLTAYGSNSFEDYLKWHENIWNETYLDQSRFDGLAPDGSIARISLDEIEIVPDGKLGGGIHRYEDKPDFHFDGEWGTETLKGDALKNPDQVKGTQNFLRYQRIFLEGSLLHEGSHQVLGAYDVYWSNQEPSEPNNPNGKVKIKDGGKHYITRGAMYPFSGLMGGDDSRPNDQYTEGTGLFELQSVMGFNLNVAFRNGFYGEWQYDVPKSVSVKLLAADGSPIPGAQVRIWQSNMAIEDQNLVATGLRAGKDGVLKLPDQDSLEAADYTTITGHTMRKKNPFGRIEVVGTNSVLLLRIDGFGQTDYRFVRLYDINRAYWMGFKGQFTLPVQTQIVPAVVDWSNNLAKGKGVQTVLGQAEAGKLTDGDRSTTWRGGNAAAGSFLQIDLGGPVVGAVRLVQSEGHGQFFQRFKIETSNDPSFRSGSSELARQFPTTFGLAMTNDRDIDPADTKVRWVTYGGSPRSARFLRITALTDSDWTSMSEIEVFGPAAK